MSERELNIVHPFMGGLIEEAKATKFGSTNEKGEPIEDPDNPGHQKMVDLPNRIVVIFGRQKKTLNGDMVKALVSLYNGKDEFSKGFRQWCDVCK